MIIKNYYFLKEEVKIKIIIKFNYLKKILFFIISKLFVKYYKIFISKLILYKYIN